MPVTSTVAPAGAVPVSFELKSAQLSLIAFIIKSKDLAIVAAELSASFGPQSESPEFFDSDGCVIDFSNVDADLPHPQWEALMVAFDSCSLVPVAVRGLNPASTVEARRFGLVEAPPEPRRSQSPRPDQAAAAVVQAEISPGKAEPVFVPREPAVAPTMVISKPLRSGQKVYARGGDLVVLAMVNRGAEVIADGNIHVYAPLRGKAMAGARGNTQARIFSLCLEPELVSIAGIYRTTEQELPSDVLGMPAQVRLSDDGKERLLIEALKS
jgi:septum site-determining protein MinC